MTSEAIKAVVDGMGWDLDAAEAADMLALAAKAWGAGQSAARAELLESRELQDHAETLVQLLAIVQLMARTLDLDTSACAIKQGSGDGNWETHTMDEVIGRASKLLGIGQTKTGVMDSSAVVH
jgi:nitrous oxidase accessory protein NosD